MKASEPLGERKIIKIIQDHLEAMPRMPVPFGDDVSAYAIGKDSLAVLKTDMLVGKTDVPRGMSLWQAARKAVVMNISDFAAKGVRPLVLLVALGLPANLTEKDIEEIGKGLNAGAREYDTHVIGGDTGESSDLMITVSVFGIARKASLALRSGAKPGDLVAVTGFFGKTSAGLKIMLENLQEKEDTRSSLVKSVTMPQARLEEGLALNKTKAVTAAIDSSDGLAWSLHEIAKASHVGFLINSLPTSEEVKRFSVDHNLDPVELTLYGGEEYELILTIKPQHWEKARKAVTEAGGGLICIGKATAKRQISLDIDGKRCIIEPRGYEHFRRSRRRFSR